MRQVRSTRVAANGEHGTFGTWVLDGRPICLTLEPYHRDNARNISCIPSGSYTLRRVQSPRYGDCFEIAGIQGRSNVLIHWGNVDDHTEGCVLLGEEYGQLDGKWAVISSKVAFNEFMSYMEGCNEANLVIVDAY